LGYFSKFAATYINYHSQRNVKKKSPKAAKIQQVADLTWLLSLNETPAKNGSNFSGMSKSQKYFIKEKGNDC
jgi:hypothetical protein